MTTTEPVPPLLVQMLADDIRSAASREMLSPAALAEALVRRGWRPAPVAWNEALAEHPTPERTDLCAVCGKYPSHVEHRHPIPEPEHRPRAEELEPGRGTAPFCEADGQSWPCDHERDLSREEPDHG